MLELIGVKPFPDIKNFAKNPKYELGDLKKIKDNF